jgi:EF hand domain-containing protein
MKLSAVSVAAAIALGAGATFAAERPTFAELDSNSDGYLSQTEAIKAPHLDFASADRNHDGRLSPSEYEAAMES